MTATQNDKQEAQHTPGESLSESGQAWRTWFDKVGNNASVEVVNATANLVITEREIYANELHTALQEILEMQSSFYTQTAGFLDGEPMFLPSELVPYAGALRVIFKSAHTALEKAKG